VARVIREIDADLVALQEVDAAPGPETVSIQMTELADAGHYMAIPGPTVIRSQRYYGNVLLTRLEIERVQRLDLSLPGREPRGAISARLRTPDGEPVRCVATHLGLSPHERRRQLGMLLPSLAAAPEPLLLLMGDLNAWSRYSIVERMLSRLLGPSPRRGSFPAMLPLFALDRIWVRPNRLLVDLHVEKTPLTREASDHLPVLARVHYPSATSTSRGSKNPANG
jgi:endonuclease/exonuclease/phosphatase family metal-dependent hydrolase